MKTRFFRSLAASLLLSAAFWPVVGPAATVSWVGGTGDWNTTSNWSTGALPGTNDDVVIGAGPALTVTHSSGAHIVQSISSQQAFVLSGGSLTVSNTVQVNSTLTLSGGTLVQAAVLQGTGGASFVVSSGALDGVTVNGNWDVGASGNGASLTVLDGLTINGTLQLGNPTNQWYGGVSFSGTQTLGGTGTVVFGNQPNTPSCNALRLATGGTTLTIGPGLLLRGQNGTIGYDPNCWGGPQDVAVINQGTISCDLAGGTITVNAQPFTNLGVMGGTTAVSGGGGFTLGGTWVNAGTINATNLIVTLGGTFATTNTGVFNRSGGTVNLTGTLMNTNSTLTLGAAGGSWVLDGGTVQGGTVTAGGGASLIVNNGTLDGVTVNGNWDVGASVNGATLTVLDGLTINGTLQVGNPTNQWYGGVSFSGTQTLGGTGTVVFGNQPNTPSCNTLRLATGGTTLTIGPGVLLRGQNGTIGYDPNCWGGPQNVTVINQGTISCDINGGTITVNAQPFTNLGAMGGTAAVSGGGGFTLAGTWVNAGTINATNLIVTLGGNFATTNIGVFNRSGGTVNLTGTLMNTNSTLTLDAAGGSWTLNGGTVQGGAITTGGGASLIVNNGTLDGVAVNGNWDVGASVNGATLTVLDGLAINGTLQVGNPTNQWYGGVNFTGTQTLGGNGTVVFGNQPNVPSCNTLRLATGGTALTIAPGVVVRGQNGTIGYDPNCWGGPQNVTVVNQGTISCDVSGGTITVNAQPFTNQSLAQGVNGGSLAVNTLENSAGGTVALNGGGSLALAGPWSNAGIIDGTNGTVILGGTFALTDLGVFNRGGGTVNLTGTLLNTNATLALNAASGSWVLDGGTVRGGAIAPTGGASLIVNNGTLDGVTVNGNWDVGASVSGASLTVLDGLTNNGTLQVGNPTNQWYGGLSFAGTQTLGGNGTVVFGNQPNVPSCNTLRLATGGTALTIAPGVVLRGQNGTIGYDPNCWGGPQNVTVVNQGTISCDVSGGTITVNAQPFTNQSLAQGVNGGSLAVNTLENSAGGTVELNGGGSLTLAGSWSNAGMIDGTNSTVNLGGTFSLTDLGVFNRGGGTVNLTGTLLNTNSTLALNAASSSWVLDGGTVRGGVIAPTGGASLIVNNGTLDGVTVNGNWDVGASVSGASLTVLDGLTNNGTLQVGNPTNQWYGGVNFTGTQTLGGTGTVVFGNQPNVPSCNTLRLATGGTALTIAPGVVLRGQNGTIGYDPNCWGGPQNVTVVNQGTISCDISGGTITVNAQPFTNQSLAQGVNGGSLTVNTLENSAGGTVGLTGGGSLTLAGSWSNAGVIDGTNGTVNLGGTFALTDLGVFNRGGGTVNLTGTLLNTNATLALDAATGSWVLDGGTVRGGVIAPTGGASLIVNNGTLDGVTVNGNWDVGASVSGASLTVLDGLTNNGTLQVGNPTNQWYGGLSFAGTQTLGGNGTVVFGNQPNVPSCNTLRLATGGTTLTIAPGVVLRGQNGTIGYDPNCWGGPQNVTVVNQGTISCDVSGGTITVNAQPFTNQSLAQGVNGGSLAVNTLENSAGGTVALNGGGGLTLAGSWSNAGVIDGTNGTVNLGGTFALTDLGVFNRGGGMVNLTGTLLNTNATLTLNAASGSWVLDGGTVRGGAIAPTGAAALIINNGTLDGVTMNGNWDVGASVSGASLTVLDGLTINGILQVGNPTNQWYGGLSFAGTQTLGGSGTVEFGNQASVPSCNTLRLASGATTLTIAPGVVLRGQDGTIGYDPNCWGGPANVTVVNQGTISCDISGGTFSIIANSFQNLGTMQATNGGLLQSSQNLANQGDIAALSGGSVVLPSLVDLNGANWIGSDPGSLVKLAGSLLGNTTNSGQFTPLGALDLNGSGTAASPQQLEVMGRDLGYSAAGFTQNFNYGSVTLANTTYVQLVDQSQNSGGSGPEALYVGSLVVPLGTTLDVNGLHVYARDLQVAGSVIHGTVTISPPLAASLNGQLLEFFWPTYIQPFILQSATNLAPPAAWTAVTNPVSVSGTTNSVTFPVSETTRFFRLKGQ